LNLDEGEETKKGGKEREEVEGEGEDRTHPFKGKLTMSQLADGAHQGEREGGCPFTE